MQQKIYRDILLWGVVLWAIGYVLGIILFAVVPANLIGWIITPIGIIITLLVLFKKITKKKLADYLLISMGWTVIAIVLDYFLLVRLFHPADGYYKPDVYLYYALTFLLPLIAGLIKQKKVK